MLCAGPRSPSRELKRLVPMSHYVNHVDLLDGDEAVFDEEGVSLPGACGVAVVALGGQGWGEGGEGR